MDDIKIRASKIGFFAMAAQKDRNKREKQMSAPRGRVGKSGEERK